MIGSATARFIETQNKQSLPQLYAILRSNILQSPLIYGGVISYELYAYDPNRRIFCPYVYRGPEAVKNMKAFASDQNELEPVKLKQMEFGVEGYDFTVPQAGLPSQWWHIPRETGQPIWTDPYFDEGGGDILMCTYSAPFFRNEKFYGVTTIDIPLEPLRELVDLDLPEEVEFSVLTQKGIYVYDVLPLNINKSLLDTAKAIGRNDMVELGKTIIKGEVGIQKLPGLNSNERKWYFYAPIPSTQWSFVASLDEKDALADVQKLLLRNAILIACSCFGMIIILWIISLQITKPISNLAGQVESVARGKLDRQVKIKGRDEISILEHTFEEMRKAVRDKINTIEKQNIDLKNSENKYRRLVENLQEEHFFYSHDTDGVFTYISPSITNVLGYTREEFYNNYKEYLTDDPINKDVIGLTNLSNAGIQQISYEVDIFSKGGGIHRLLISEVPVFDETGRVFAFEGIAHDITKQRKMEETVKQTQKMEAIGTLAGGIAHDFNNILMGIVGYTELTQGDIPADSPVQKYLNEILKSATRAKELVRQILTFSRKSQEERISIKLSTIIKECTKLLRSTIPTTIEIRQNIDNKGCMVHADPAQMHQVVMNLCTNAAHAMQESGGLLGIDLSLTQITQESMSKYDNVSLGPFIELKISDTGTGIEPRIVHRVFEPFFTTKEQDKGTGMGLSVVHGIVKDHDGYITVESHLSKGTTFTILLPQVLAKDVKNDSTPSSIPTGSEHILFVDDEKMLVDLGKRIFESLGYKVTAISSSIEALEIFNQSPDDFDIVITDQTMPHMTGYHLANKILESKPSLPIILCTGYSDTISQEKVASAGIKALVYKPIRKNEIACRIRETLDKK
jgi:two-component system, cell cycle sensor histidine kinase and response regulator CckA